MNQSTTKSYLAALLMSIIIGFSFLATKIGLQDGKPLEILAHRFTFAFIALVLLFVLGFFHFKLDKGELLKILPISFFYPITFFGLQILGIAKISTSEAAIIQATTPIITMTLAALFLNEKTNTRQKFFVLLSLSGVIYISLMKPLDGNSSSLFGIILLLFSSLGSAANMVLVRKMVPKYGFQKITTMGIVSGFLFFNGIYIIERVSTGQTSSYFRGVSHPSFLWSLLFLGVLSTLGSSLLANYALKGLEASRASIFTHLATIISILAGMVILNESLYGYQILGGLLIIIGVIGTNYYSNKSKKGS